MLALKDMVWARGWQQHDNMSVSLHGSRYLGLLRLHVRSALTISLESLSGEPVAMLFFSHALPMLINRTPRSD